MKNKYLLISGYYTTFIRNDLKSLLLYYDFFSQGIFLPKYLSNRYLRRAIHGALKILIISAYVSGVYRLKYKVLSIEDDSLLMIKGKHSWSSTIKLVEEKGVLKIVKKLSNKKIYAREKQFYNQYKYIKSKIRLPKNKFLSSNTVEMEFIKGKSLFRLINDGTLDYQQTLKHFVEIKRELTQSFYKKKVTFVHGDLDCGNILIKDGYYYLIDYSDAQEKYYYWDLYKLFFSMLASFYYITYNEILLPKIVKNNKLYKLLGLTSKEIKKADDDNVKLLNIQLDNEQNKNS